MKPLTKMRTLAGLFMPLVALMACNQTKDPLGDLTPDDRVFLFGQTDTHVPFLGQPVDNGPLNCYPQRMNQGYVLVDGESSIYLDSIRPTGIERHNILSVVKTDKGFDVKAKNGVSAPFDLIIERQGRDRALISWDGAPAQPYRRCERAGD
jgi:hypothetical protein